MTQSNNPTNSSYSGNSNLAELAYILASALFHPVPDQFFVNLRAEQQKNNRKISWNFRSRCKPHSQHPSREVLRFLYIPFWMFESNQIDCLVIICTPHHVSPLGTTLTT